VATSTPLTLFATERPVVDNVAGDDAMVMARLVSGSEPRSSWVEANMELRAEWDAE
jgi:hypothetical protein